MLYQVGTPEGESLTAAYRLMLSDALPFATGVRLGLERGPTNNLALRARTVAYAYVAAPGSPLERVDVLDLGDAVSRVEHQYQADGGYEVRLLDGLFEGEPPTELVASAAYRGAGTARFVLDASACASRLRLRWRHDAAAEGQSADVRVDGGYAGAFSYTGANPHRRWREADLELAASLPSAPLSFEVVAHALNSAGEHSEQRYELWCQPRRPDCSDGLDNDGDGLIDFVPDGDGDGIGDFPGDPACKSADFAGGEERVCQNGLDDDGDGFIDYDGGASLDLDQDGFIDPEFDPAEPAVAGPDPDCSAPWRGFEGRRRRCGLGAEWVLLLPPLLLWRYRRRRLR
jgi:hypothetical protein